ncbi:DUF421 domain-containing protein [Cytobacillus sp. S13-E01]|uniref:DUF421 domain-containing protein n=1 Tax=Cytobacillus sp. S13-E01 TaxID=3031326 RepID=UPI0023D8A30D|nr:DUF421 domain-containing protein [Cytobacillus sp. S13-E01]MDF0726797.1 DUF421 domain-containing protein [Cytobacillus sp. S13-E01]
MEEYLIISARTLFLYFVILFVFRLMGKREIGELSILDLVVSIMIAEMAVVAIENTKDPLLHTIYPMIILMVIQIGLAYLSLKSQKLRDIIDGKPTVIIDKGKIDEHEMRKQRYNLDDLLLQLREKDIRNVADVEFAILEPSGKLSVFQKDKTKPQSETFDFEWPVILDGIVQEEQLERLNKTNLWLRQQLRKLGYKEIKKISYCTYNNNNDTFYIDIKDEKK